MYDIKADDESGRSPVDVEKHSEITTRVIYDTNRNRYIITLPKQLWRYHDAFNGPKRQLDLQDPPPFDRFISWRIKNQFSEKPWNNYYSNISFSYQVYLLFTMKKHETVKRFPQLLYEA